MAIPIIPIMRGGVKYTTAGLLSSLAGKSVSALRGVAMNERKRRIALITRTIVKNKGVTPAVKRLRKRYGITPRNEEDAFNATIAIVIHKFFFGKKVRNKPAENYFRNFNAPNTRGFAGLERLGAVGGGIHW